MRARLRHALARLTTHFRRDRLDRDLDEDLQTHLALLTDEFVARGMDRTEARRQAMLRFGNVLNVTELHRETRGVGWIDRLVIESRLAWRGVRARGWQAGLVIVLLGVAIGANTILFSAADAFVFRRASYPEADRLAVISRHGLDISVSDYIAPRSIPEWRAQRDLFDAVHAHSTAAQIYVTTGDVTEPVLSQSVTPGFFEMLGVRPLWGRTFTAEDAGKGARPVLILAEEIAAKAFGNPADAIGKRMPHSSAGEIVGVMPEAFRFPTSRERIWRPFDLSGQQEWANVRNVVRLAPGVTFARALSGVEARMPEIQRISAGQRTRVRPVTLKSLAASRENLRFSSVFVVLAAAASCLLLIACANVASLELAAAVRRARATAVQAALGADRGTLLRTRAIEVAMLVAGSIASAAAMASWGTGALTATLPPPMARQLTNAIDLDGRAITFMAVAAGLAWLLTSLPAVVRATGRSLVDTLRDDSRVMPASATASRVRQVLVICQVAATIVLVVGALLYLRTYAARVGLDKGFDSRNLAAVEVFPSPGAPLRGAELIAATEAALQSHSGVAAVARTGNILPANTSGITSKLFVEGRQVTEHWVKLTAYAVEPRYFATLGIPVLAGRLFEPRESMASVIIDEAFARRFWPNGNAVGSSFNMQSARFGDVKVHHVVGIAKAVRPESSRTEEGAESFLMYHAIDNPAYGGFIARLHTPQALADVIGAVRRRAPGTWVRADMLDDRYARLEGDRRLAAGATTALSLLAIVIAALGIYAVIGFMVSARTREIGIRMALGAERRHICQSVLRSSLTLVAVGAAIGLAAAFAASRWIESQLYGVSPTDPLTYGCAALAVLIVAAVATWHPARQATRVDPAITLKSL